jgi:hypothetical protein
MNTSIRLLEENLLNELNASPLPIEAKRLILSDLLTMTTRQADITIKEELANNAKGTSERELAESSVNEHASQSD